MKVHKFKLGNPCSPCEWHIVSGVRVFAWFDFIFQAVFVIPVILGFNVTVKHLDEMRKDVNDTKCIPEKADLALYYNLFDLINLSSGIFSDIILYIGDKKGTLRVRLWVAGLFLGVSILRQFMHLFSITMHIIRCSSGTFPYEFMLRLLCQYLLYGMWLVSEYVVWLHNGCQFVPERGQMEPPDEESKGYKLPLNFPTISTSDNSQLVASTYVSSAELLGEGDDMYKTKDETKMEDTKMLPDQKEERKKPKRKSSVNRRKSKEKRKSANISNPTKSQKNLAPK